jgi:hypothetical protein
MANWGTASFEEAKKIRRFAKGWEDDAVPKWAPRFLRLSQDQLKTKKDFTPVDLQEIEHFAHYTQMAFLGVRLSGILH